MTGEGGPEMGLTFRVREISVAVEDIGRAAETLSRVFLGDVDQVVDFPEEGLQLEMGGTWIGDFHVALVHDASGQGPVGRFVERRGEGFFELNVQTNDLPAAIAHCKRQGLRFLSEEPKILRNYEWKGEVFSELRIVFLDPATTHGVLIELGEWVK